MAAKESSLLKLVLTLTLISLFAAAALASVYVITKEPIAQSSQKKKSNAIQAIIQSYNPETGHIKSETVNIEGEEEPVTVHIAYQDETVLGIVVETYTNKAFGGRFDIMVGFDVEKDIVLGTEVLSHGETPGLGDKIDKKKSEFSTQFTGKNLAEMNLKVKKEGGEVDAITAATISSKAFCDALERGQKAYLLIKEKLNLNPEQAASEPNINEEETL